MERVVAKRAVALCMVILVMASSVGCESLSRKFIRKSKAEKEPIKMVLSPEEYTGPAMTKEERYRHYFFYWESWHDELIQALTADGNKKKQRDSADEALKNLAIVRGLLSEERGQALEGHIAALQKIAEEVDNDMYNSDTDNIRSRTEDLKMQIKKGFSYSDVKDSLR